MSKVLSLLSGKRDVIKERKLLEDEHVSLDNFKNLLKLLTSSEKERTLILPFEDNHVASHAKSSERLSIITLPSLQLYKPILTPFFTLPLLLFFSSF